MDGGLQNQQGIIQTYCDNLWNVQFSSHFSIDDGCYLADMIDDSIVIIYMDNIFIFTPDELTLKENTKVLTWFQENNLFLKPAKFDFNKTKVEYLGMDIEERKISMDPGKLLEIRDWCEPMTVKQVWWFLGFVNFYWWFIWNFSEKAKLLKDLLKKDHQFWMDEWLARSIWQLK